MAAEEFTLIFKCVFMVTWVTSVSCVSVTEPDWCTLSMSAVYVNRLKNITLEISIK